MAGGTRRRLGDRGEQLAVDALAQAGLAIVARNWRCPSGEIDVVAQEQAADYAAGGAVVPWLVLVEVRTRRGNAFGSARQSITPRKQAKLREVAGHYLQSTGWAGPWRIDVVAVQMDADGRLLEVEHIRHAVTG
jgi:putative endonuclease